MPKRGDVVGAKIKEIRPMTNKEMADESWSAPSVVLELDNGTMLFASCDPEGNGPGMIFGKTKKGKGFRLA